MAGRSLMSVSSLRTLSPSAAPERGRSLLARRLSALATLSDEDMALVSALPLERRHAAADVTLLAADRPPRCMIVLQEGWALQCRRLADGRRQIVSIHLPGDLIGLSALAEAASPTSVRTVTPAVFGMVDPPRVAELFARSPALTLAFHRLVTQESGVLTELVVSLGRLTAYERVAHLVVGLSRRLCAVGLAEPDRFSLPLTQAEISDHLGLSPVHVNRTLQQLRRDGLLDIQRRTAILPDPERLAAIAAF